MEKYKCSERLNRLAVSSFIEIIIWKIKKHFWKPEDADVNIDSDGNTFLNGEKTSLIVKWEPCKYAGMKYVLIGE